MQPSLKPSDATAERWTYAKLMVLDGPRALKPTHASFGQLRFAQPPRLSGEQIEIILTNGDAEQRHRAAVLPHDSDATCIPIRLMPMG